MSDEAYNKKLQELQQHIPFMENMIAQLKDPKWKPREAQLNKMESLYFMITDRNKKWKYDTLLKCEEVILKLQTKVKANRPIFPVEGSKEQFMNPERPDVQSTVHDIMNALKFSNARAKLNSEIMSTPKSPSPMRDLTPHSPKIIPFEATNESTRKSTNIIDPQELSATWHKDDVQDRYVNEKPDIYNSAARSLGVVSLTRGSIFDRLGPVVPEVTEKPLLSDADLEMLRAGDDFVVICQNNQRQTPTKQQPEKSLESINLKITPRIKPVPASKPKNHASESPLEGAKSTKPIKKIESSKEDKHKSVQDTSNKIKVQDKDPSNKIKSPKSEKVEKKLTTCDIFGNCLSSIDNMILEDTKKKDKKKDERRHSSDQREHKDKEHKSQREHKEHRDQKEQRKDKHHDSRHHSKHHKHKEKSSKHDSSRPKHESKERSIEKIGIPLENPVEKVEVKEKITHDKLSIPVIDSTSYKPKRLADKYNPKPRKLETNVAEKPVDDVLSNRDPRRRNNSSVTRPNDLQSSMLNNLHNILPNSNTMQNKLHNILPSSNNMQNNLHNIPSSVSATLGNPPITNVIPNSSSILGNPCTNLLMNASNMMMSNTNSLLGNPAFPQRVMSNLNSLSMNNARNGNNIPIIPQHLSNPIQQPIISPPQTIPIIGHNLQLPLPFQSSPMQTWMNESTDFVRPFKPPVFEPPPPRRPSFQQDPPERINADPRRQPKFSPPPPPVSPSFVNNYVQFGNAPQMRNDLNFVPPHRTAFELPSSNFQQGRFEPPPPNRYDSGPNANFSNYKAGGSNTISNRKGFSPFEPLDSDKKKEEQFPYRRNENQSGNFRNNYRLDPKFDRYNRKPGAPLSRDALKTIIPQEESLDKLKGDNNLDKLKEENASKDKLRKNEKPIDAKPKESELDTSVKESTHNKLDEMYSKLERDTFSSPLESLYSNNKSVAKSFQNFKIPKKPKPEKIEIPETVAPAEDLKFTKTEENYEKPEVTKPSKNSETKNITESDDSEDDDLPLSSRLRRRIRTVKMKIVDDSDEEKEPEQIESKEKETEEKEPEEKEPEEKETEEKEPEEKDPREKEPEENEPEEVESPTKRVPRQSAIKARKLITTKPPKRKLQIRKSGRKLRSKSVVKEVENEKEVEEEQDVDVEAVKEIKGESEIFDVKPETAKPESIPKEEPKTEVELEDEISVDVKPSGSSIKEDIKPKEEELKEEEKESKPPNEVDKAKEELLNEAKKKNLNLDNHSAEVLEFILMNYKKIKKIFKSDSSSDEEEKEKEKRKKKKKRERSSSSDDEEKEKKEKKSLEEKPADEKSIKDDEKEVPIEAKKEEKLEEQEIKDMEPSPNEEKESEKDIESKKADESLSEKPEEIGEEKEIDEEQDQIITTTQPKILRKKVTKKRIIARKGKVIRKKFQGRITRNQTVVASAKPMKPRRSELDKLHDDIKEMLMGGEVLTSTGKRACTMPKDDSEDSLSKRGDYSEDPLGLDLNPLLPMKSVNNLRVLIEKTDLVKLITKDKIKHEIEELVEGGKQEVDSLPPKLEKMIASPINRGPLRRKILRKNKWASGIIGRKNKTKLSISDDKSEEAGISTSTNSEEVGGERSVTNKPHDKAYFTDGSKSFCKLCNFRGKYIIQHYKSVHPLAEVVISRMAPKVTEFLINDAKNKNYESVVLKDIQHLRKQRFGYKCPFMCPIGATMDFTENYYDHVTSHTGEYRYFCPFCSFATSNSRNLRAHMVAQHNSNLEAYGKPISSAPHASKYVFGYVCRECYYVQTNKERVEKHVREYHGDNMVEIIKINLSLICMECEETDAKTSTPQIANSSAQSLNHISEAIESVVKGGGTVKEATVVKCLNIFDLRSQIEADDEPPVLVKMEPVDPALLPESLNFEETPTKSKNLDLGVFTCNTSFLPTDDEESIEQRRLKKMNEIHGTAGVRPARISIADKLQSRLETTVQEEPVPVGIPSPVSTSVTSTNPMSAPITNAASPIVTISAPTIVTNTISPVITSVQSDTISSSVPPPLIPIDRPKKSLELIPKKVTVPEMVTEPKKVAPISNIINRLQDKIKSSINDTMNKHGANSTLQIGPITITINRNETLYSCFVPFCVFNTVFPQIFDTHCKVTHKDYIYSQNKCEICHVKIDREDQYVTMHDIYEHICTTHSDFLAKKDIVTDVSSVSSETDSMSQSSISEIEAVQTNEVPNVILQADENESGTKYPFIITNVISVEATESNKESASDIEKSPSVVPVVPHEVPNLITQNDSESGSKFPFVITNVTSVDKPSFALPHDVPNLIAQGDNESGPRFPFIITSVTSLAKKPPGLLPPTTLASSIQQVQQPEPNLVPIVSAPISSIIPISIISPIQTSPIIKPYTITSINSSPQPSPISSVRATQPQIVPIPSRKIQQIVPIPSRKKTQIVPITTLKTTPQLVHIPTLKSTPQIFPIKTTKKILPITSGQTTSPVVPIILNPLAPENEKSKIQLPVISSVQSLAPKKDIIRPKPFNQLTSNAPDKVTIARTSGIVNIASVITNDGKNLILEDIPLTAEEKKNKKTKAARVAMFAKDVISNFYKCGVPQCSFSSNKSQELITHMPVHKAEYVNCLYCDYKMIFKMYIIHLEVHHANCEYACGYCFYRTTNAAFVLAHLKIKHPKEEPSIVKTPREFMPTRINFQKLVPIKNILKPYVCGQPGCNLKTIFSGIYYDHILSAHPGISKIICGICKTGLAAMNTHWAFHNVHAFHCRYCPMGSKNMKDIVNHQSALHYKNDYCIIFRKFVPNPIYPEKSALSYSVEDDATYDRLFMLYGGSLPNEIITESDTKIDDKETSTENEQEMGDTDPLLFLEVDMLEQDTTLPIPDKPINSNTSTDVTVNSPFPVASNIVFESAPTSDEPEIPLFSEMEEDAIDPLSFDDTNGNISDGDSNDEKDLDVEVVKYDATSVKHTEEYSGIMLYKCTCQLRFEDKFKFKHHISACQRDNYKCAHCGVDKKSVRALLTHMNEHGRKRFKCSLCQYKHFSKRFVRDHMNIDHSITDVMLLPATVTKKIDYGNDDFVLRPKLSGLRRVGSAAPATSTVNKRIFSPKDVDQLPRPPIYQTDVLCSVCNYATKVKSNMVRHLQAHQNEQEVPMTAPVNPVPCLEKSEKMFDKMVNLALSSHTTGKTILGATVKVGKIDENNTPNFIPINKRYVCGAENCNYLCPEEGMLRRHLLTFHSLELNYTCLHCNTKLFDDKLINMDMILKHLKLHDNHLYSCSACKFIHNLKHKVERHVADKHADTPVAVIIVRELGKEGEPTPSVEKEEIKKDWRCAMCKLKFATMEEVKIHTQVKHNVISKNKCALCEFGSEDVTSFGNHFEINHSNQTVDIFVAYYKEDEVPQKVDVEPEFNTAPLWQRQKSIKHIRGILIDEPNNKLPKTTTPKKPKTLKAKRLENETNEATKKEFPLFLNALTGEFSESKNPEMKKKKIIRRNSKTATPKSKEKRDSKDSDNDIILIDDNTEFDIINILDDFTEDYSEINKTPKVKESKKTDNSKLSETSNTNTKSSNDKSQTIVLPGSQTSETSKQPEKNFEHFLEELEPQKKKANLQDKNTMELSTNSLDIDDEILDFPQINDDDQFITQSINDVIESLNQELKSVTPSPEPRGEKLNESKDIFAQNSSESLNTSNKESPKNTKRKMQQSKTPTRTVTKSRKNKNLNHKIIKPKRNSNQKPKAETIRESETIFNLDDSSEDIDKDSASFVDSLLAQIDLTDASSNKEDSNEKVSESSENIISPNTSLDSCLKNIKVVSVCSLKDKPSEIIEDKKEVEKNSPVEILDDEDEDRAGKKIKLDVSIKEIEAMSRSDLLNGNFMGTFGPYGSPWNGQYKCPLCEKYMSSSSKEFMAHIYEELQYGLYQCSLCDYKEMTRAKVSQHLAEYHADNKSAETIKLAPDHQIVEWVTKLIVFQARILTLEIESGSVNIAFTHCNFCDYKSSIVSDLRKHQIRHWAVRPYSCALCKFDAIHKTIMEKHMKRNHPNAPINIKANDLGDGVVIRRIRWNGRVEKDDGIEAFETFEMDDEIDCNPDEIIDVTLSCCYCYTRGMWDDLKTHISEKHPGEDFKVYRYRCNYCTSTFISLRTLNQHFISCHHEMRSSYTEISEETQRYQCPICPISDNSLNSMKEHLKSHYKAMKCLYCDSSFVFWKTIRKHCREEHPIEQFEFMFLLIVEKEYEEALGKIKVAPITKSGPANKKYNNKKRKRPGEDIPEQLQPIIEQSPVLIEKADSPKIIRKVARKSTGYKKIKEIESHYGKTPDCKDFSRIITSIDVMGTPVTMNIIRLSKILNISPIVLVEDCKDDL